MTSEDFFIIETFDAPAAPEVDETATQGELFAISTYQGPKNRRGVENVAMIDVFGNVEG